MVPWSQTSLSLYGLSLQEVISSGNPHNAVFSPTRLQNTACQLYFLLLGRLSRSDTGRSYLDRSVTIMSQIRLIMIVLPGTM